MNTELIEFHDTDLYCPIRDGEIYIAIKPICNALGIDNSSQQQRIKQDKILGQLWCTITTTGHDQKSYKMFCLPLMYVFGWLFNIDEEKIKSTSKEQLLSYKLECYQVLYEHFYLQPKRYKARDAQILSLQGKIDIWEEKRRDLGREIKSNKAEIRRLLSTPIDQLELFDPETKTEK